MKCYKCTHELPEKSEVCTRCGEKQNAPPPPPPPPRPPRQVAPPPKPPSLEREPLLCEVCGKQIHMSEQHCRQCNTINKAALKEPSLVSTILTRFTDKSK